MRVVIDTMGAPEQSGGMHLYARELVLAWATSQPNDELIVIGGRWLDSFDAGPSVRAYLVNRSGFLARAWTQLVLAERVRRRTDADVLISVSPIVSPLTPRMRRACIVHDWRHRAQPGEFSKAQLLYRKLWSWSAKNAGVAIAISEKTRDETLRFAPGSRVVVVPNGGDHPARWNPIDRTGAGPAFLTFGHHSNKRPDLVLRAFARLVRDGTTSGNLTILGARGSVADNLRQLAIREGVVEHVALPGFVSDAEYQRFVATSGCVVLASTDEGFGLPVVEAMYFGIPAVATTDGGLGQIHGAAVILAAPTPASLGAAMATATDQAPSPSPSTWATTANAIRQQLLRLQLG